MRFSQPVPILRRFKEASAREFHVDFLGFKVDWEHRFAPGLPLYMQPSLGDCVLHLSEHHSDCDPDGAMRVEMQGLDAFEAKLLARQYQNTRRAIQSMA